MVIFGKEKMISSLHRFVMMEHIQKECPWAGIVVIL